MVTTINITVGKDHFVRCATETIARDGEGLVHRFAIEIPENFADLWAYLDFKLPNGEKYKTARLPIENALIAYDVPAYVLNGDGVLKVQLVLQDGNGLVWKSNTKKFTVRRSINAVDDIPEKEDFIAEAQKILDEIKYGDNTGGSTINVKQLGVTGDGTPEDIKKIQDALNTYGTIVLPEGVYRVKGLTITKSNTKIVGENATLQITDDCNLTGYTTEPNCLFIKSTDPANPVRNVEISGIHFDGNATDFFKNGGYKDIKKVITNALGEEEEITVTELVDVDTVDKFGNNGIVLANAENVTVHHCTFNNLKGRGITSDVESYDDRDVNHYGVHGLHVYDCDFNNKPLPYKTVTIPSGEKYPDGTDVAAGTYKIMPHTNAIQILQSGGNECDSDIVVERCTVHKSPNYGFMFYPSTQRLTIRNCVIKNCGLYTSEEASETTPITYIDYGYYRRSVTGDDKRDHSDGSCIKLNTVRDVVVENNYLHSAKASNITIHTALKETYDANGKKWANLKWPSTKNVVIRNNYIAGGADQRRTGHGILVENGEDVRILGNTIVDQIGVEDTHAVWGTTFSKPAAISANVPCLISGNTIENCSNGFVLYGGQIVDNIINNTSKPMYFGTTSARTAENIIVKGNKIGRTATNYDVCIDLKKVKNAIVSENMITNYSRGVQVHESSYNVTTCGNIFKDCSRPIICVVVDTMKTASDPKQIEDGGVSYAHENVNIYGNSFTKTVKDTTDLSTVTTNTVVWEISGHKELVNGKDTAVTHYFKPANAKVDFAAVPTN